MRDDISALLKEYICAHKIKLSLLREFLAEEHHLNSVLKTDFDNEPVLVMNSQNNLINLVNVQDYAIASLEENFFKKTGLHIDSSLRDLSREDSGLVKEAENCIKMEKKTLTEVMSLRDKNIDMMENIKLQALKDADELKRIMELEPDFPEDEE